MIGKQPLCGTISRIATSLTLVALISLLVGCESNLQTRYGRRTGSGASSVNGTTVLGDMFAKAGHDVRSWAVLSPSLYEADVIVWAPNDFALPPDSARAWLEDWLLYTDEEKILIYIGRDYDAAPHYWTYAKQNAPASQQKEIGRRLRMAKRRVTQNQADLPAATEWSDWFSIDGSAQHEKISKLSGPWSEGIDASKTDIEHHARLVPNEHADVLLATADGEPLVSETIFGWDEEEETGENEYTHFDYGNDSRLIVIENGSFLLNMPLVNHEHRKLAGKLVAHVGSPRKRVVFLQTYQGGPPVRDTDPNAQTPTGLTLFAVWPLNGVLVHLALLGFVYAMARWPVFGVPRLLARDSLTDFGAHVSALGSLLSETGDANFARNALKKYRQTVLKEDIVSSSTHSKIEP